MVDQDDPLPESEIEDATADANSAALAKKHDQAMRRFDSVATPQIPVRADALLSRRFVSVPGAQWESSFSAEWAENAPRPEIDKITKSLEKIETDYRENRLTVDFVPVGESANADTADTLDGMHRADSYDFKAEQGRDNAFQEGIRGGFGAWCLATEYANPYEDDDDAQRIIPAVTIVEADQSVYFDGASVLYDKSDAKWAFIITADPRATAEDEWGSDNLADWPLVGWRWNWDWYTPDLVYTAKYYEVEEVTDKIVTMTQKVSGETLKFYESEIEPSEIRDLTAQGWTKSTKAGRRRRVHLYIMNGTRILKDCGYIAGPNIPIVPFYGRRDWINGQERFRGHVLKKMDPARIYNAKVGSLLEADAIGPHETPVFDPTQIDSTMADQWARANIDRLPYLTAYALRDGEGHVVSTGPSFMIKKPDVSANTAALLQISAGDLSDDDQNADEVKANTSADAMDIAAARIDAKSGIYLDNMRQSLQREGEIYKGMAREIYWEPGRKVSTLSADGKDGEATLAEPYLDEAKVFRTRNDLTQGDYKVIASVQESTTTMRQKTVRQNLQLAEVAVQAQDLELAKVSLLVATMNQDGEGMAITEKYARRQLLTLGLIEPTPEEKAEMDQAAQSQQPNPAEQAAMAEAQSKTALNAASAQEKQAGAMLKVAQAQAVGGPEAAPEVPSGLDHATGAVDVVEKLASADLKTAQAAHLRHGMGLKDREHAHTVDIEHRQQDHAENTAPGAE